MSKPCTPSEFLEAVAALVASKPLADAVRRLAMHLRAHTDVREAGPEAARWSSKRQSVTGMSAWAALKAGTAVHPREGADAVEAEFAKTSHWERLARVGAQHAQAPVFEEWSNVFARLRGADVR